MLLLTYTPPLLLTYQPRKAKPRYSGECRLGLPQTITFEGGEYALFGFRQTDGTIRLLLFKEYGRKLKRGKRRKPIVGVTLTEECMA